MKKCRRIAAGMLFLTMFLFAAGCGVDITEPGTEETTAPTVGDIFTQEPTGSTVKDTEPGDETDPAYVVEDDDTTGMTFLENVEYLNDEIGAYLTYEGGEMAYTFDMGLGGRLAREGVALILYLDGQIQPYRMENGTAYAMCHTFYPHEGTVKDRNDQFNCRYTIYFSPVTGAAGDCLEMQIAILLDPDFSVMEEGTEALANQLSQVMGVGVYRIKFLADPEYVEPVALAEKAVRVSAEKVEAAAGDVAGWSDQDWYSRIEYAFHIDGYDPYAFRGPTVYEHTPEEHIELTLQIWGRPGIRYAIIVYMDKQPVYLGEGGLMVETEMGYKNVINVSLDASDTDGETIIWVDMIPLNTLGTGEGGLWVGKRSTETFYVFTESYEEVKASAGAG